MAIDFYSERRISEGDEVLNQMQRRGLVSCSPELYEAKVRTLFVLGNVNEALHVVEREMLHNNCIPTTRLHNIVINGLCDVGECDWAMKYFEKMSRPDRETYSYLVDGMCRAGEYLEASRVLERMCVSSYWPGAETYNKIIRGLCSVGNTYRAVMWLEEMMSQAKMPDSSVWWSLVSSVCVEGIEVQSWRNLKELQFHIG